MRDTLPTGPRRDGDLSPAAAREAARLAQSSADIRLHDRSAPKEATSVGRRSPRDGPTIRRESDDTYQARHQSVEPGKRLAELHRRRGAGRAARVRPRLDV